VVSVGWLWSLSYDALGAFVPTNETTANLFSAELEEKGLDLGIV
jgi:hypothetical protein